MKTLPPRLVRATALVLAILMLAPLVPIPPATAQVAVIDPANLEQNLGTRLQTWTAILQRITQIANQIRQIRIQIESLYIQYRNLVELGLNFDPIISRIRELIAAYHNLLREGQALVYTANNLESRFREIFDPFPADIAWREEQLLRSQTSLDTYLAILRANGEFGRTAIRTQIKNEELTAQALGTGGNLEALHAQALIQAHTAQEVSKTVDQLASLNNILAVHFANEIASRESLERSFDRWLDPLTRTAPYEGYPQLPSLPGRFGRFGGENPEATP
jgi:P-type conjugative transfer protein TrbJ